MALLPDARRRRGARRRSGKSLRVVLSRARRRVALPRVHAARGACGFFACFEAAVACARMLVCLIPLCPLARPRVVICPYFHVAMESTHTTIRTMKPTRDSWRSTRRQFHRCACRASHSSWVVVARIRHDSAARRRDNLLGTLCTLRDRSEATAQRSRCGTSKNATCSLVKRARATPTATMRRRKALLA